MENSYPHSAADVARQRLDDCLREKLSGEWDTSAWEFYAYLLDQARKHPIDASGFASEAYKQDRAAALENTRRKRIAREEEESPFNRYPCQARKNPRIA